MTRVSPVGHYRYIRQGFSVPPISLHMPSTPTLHFFCGKAGAGKSTIASRRAQDHSAILWSEDIWLTRLFGDQMKTFGDYVRYSRNRKAVVGPLAVDLLRTGHSVVLDFQ